MIPACLGYVLKKTIDQSILKMDAFSTLCFLIILFTLLADVNNPEWTRHKKHVFVFSEAGKPIYSR